MKSFKALFTVLAVAVISVVFITAGVSFADLNQGLVAYYPFNGNANDESGNGNNGTVDGATLTTDRFGKGNSAYYFDGKSKITVPTSPSLEILGHITVSAWVRTSGTNKNSMIVRKVGINNLNTGFSTLANYYNNGKFTCGIFSSKSTVLHSATSVIDGKWHHLLFTHDGQYLKVYVDANQ